MEFLKKPKQSSYPGGTSDKVVEEFYNLIKDKPNDLTNKVKLLNNMKKILKKVSANALPTNLAFSSIVTRKGKKEYREIHGRHKCTLTKFGCKKVLDLLTITI